MTRTFDYSYYLATKGECGGIYSVYQTQTNNEKERDNRVRSDSVFAGRVEEGNARGVHMLSDARNVPDRSESSATPGSCVIFISPDIVMTRRLPLNRKKNTISHTSDVVWVGMAAH